MGDKSVETLGSKIQVLSVLVTFSPSPPKQCLFFYFFDCTDHSTYTTLNWGAGDTRELTLDANKIEQMLKYRKASFPESLSTTFVTHCRHVIWLKSLTNLCITRHSNYLFVLPFFKIHLLLPEWKETENPLLVLQSIGEVEERRLETMLVTLHSQAQHLNLVSAQKLYTVGFSQL